MHLGLGSEHAPTQCLLVSVGFFGMSCVVNFFLPDIPLRSNSTFIESEQIPNYCVKEIGEGNFKCLVARSTVRDVL